MTDDSLVAVFNKLIELQSDNTRVLTQIAADTSRSAIAIEKVQDLFSNGFKHEIIEHIDEVHEQAKDTHRILASPGTYLKIFVALMLGLTALSGCLFKAHDYLDSAKIVKVQP